MDYITQGPQEKKKIQGQQLNKHDGLVQNAMDIVEFNGLSVGRRSQLSNSTICRWHGLGRKGDLEQINYHQSYNSWLWACIRVTSKLFQSNLFGINREDTILEAAFTFLSCCDDSLAFKFLGLLVGSNARRVSTWVLFIEKLNKILVEWKGDICRW